MSSDLHLRFERWLLAGAAGEPPRDLALHASVCGECTARIAAFDLLTLVDAGRAPLPPSRPAQRSRSPLLRLARAGGAVAGVVLLAGVVGAGLGSAIDLRLTQAGSGESEAPAQGVLGATGQPSPTATDRTQTSAPTASPTEWGTTGAAATPGAETARPATPRPSTDRPSASPKPTATGVPTLSASPMATSSPTTVPTEIPTETPSPMPTPTPTPSPMPTPSPTATPTPTPTPTPSPTPTPTPTPIESTSPTPSP